MVVLWLSVGCDNMILFTQFATKHIVWLCVFSIFCCHIKVSELLFNKKSSILIQLSTTRYNVIKDYMDSKVYGFFFQI